MIGVEQTDNLSRILPSELGALADPWRTADLIRRIGERSAMGYAMRGKERTAKGPILVALDLSGSMSEGDKDAWSKAVALAILDIARHERRAFGVCLFNGGIVETFMAPKPHEVSPIELLDVLSREPDGGTRFAPPVTWALDIIESARESGKFKRADLVMITDGEASRDGASELRERADELGAVVFGIEIQSRGALASWCHQSAAIDDVSHDTKATDLIFDKI